MNVKILAECYLNTCIANEITKKASVKTEIIHKRTFGREKILKEVKTYIKKDKLTKYFWLLIIKKE